MCIYMNDIYMCIYMCTYCIVRSGYFPLSHDMFSYCTHNIYVTHIYIYTCSIFRSGYVPISEKSPILCYVEGPYISQYRFSRVFCVKD